jgi:hypothetical protein
MRSLVSESERPRDGTEFTSLMDAVSLSKAPLAPTEEEAGSVRDA